MTPVLKWAGGKTQLLEAITAKMPKAYNRYYEPFLGGGAVLLHVAPDSAAVNDINPQLVNLYQQLKAAPEAVLHELKALDAVICSRERYEAIRRAYNEKITKGEADAECAALMIWLNKHCFNGLYRVNAKGLFNVPYNNRTGGKSVDADNLKAVGAYLQRADVAVTCLDFEAACADVGPGDFVYFDSPYVPESETANFTDYTMGGFGMEDHGRLARLFRRLDALGAFVMLSNNDVAPVHALYAGFSIERIAVKRMINSKAAKRTGKEVLITNY